MQIEKIKCNCVCHNDNTLNHPDVHCTECIDEFMQASKVLDKQSLQEKIDLLKKWFDTGSLRTGFLVMNSEVETVFTEIYELLKK